MKKAIGILAMQALLLAPAYGQFETPNRMDVNMTRSKTLLVETQSEVTRTLMDLESKPDEQKRYKDGVASYNLMLETIVKKYWKFNKKIEFMPEPDVAALVRDGKAGKYDILHYTVQNSSIDPMDIGPVYGSGDYNDSIRDFSKSKGYAILAIQLVNSSDRKTQDVYSVALPVAYPSGADIVFALQNMQYVFGKVMKVNDYEVKEYRAEVEKNNRLLKRKTLLIAKSQVSPKTTLQDLKDEYYHPIEIVDYKTINDAVMGNDSSYAYVEVIPAKSTETTVSRFTLLRDLVLDAKDGKILATAKPNRMNHEKVADDISKKEVKEFLLDQ